MNSRLADVSDYLLKLYARSSEDNATAYTSFALDGMSELLRADKAWWGVLSMSGSGPRLSSSFRSRLPAHWEVAWEAVKNEDSLAKALAQRKNHSVSLAFSAPSRLRSRLSDLADEFNISEAMSVAIDLPDRDSFMFVSSYRSSGRGQFTAEDKSMNQLLMPHLYASWRGNVRERLRDCSEGGDACSYKAFVDRDGKLVQHEEGFAAVLSKHYNSWNGQLLPVVFREAIERSGARDGNWIGTDSWAVRTMPAGLLALVELRNVTALDRLRPRELQVARLFGEGASHKDIARLTGLMPSTVRHYVREVYAKVGVDNKAALANLLNRRRDSGRGELALHGQLCATELRST